MKTDVVIVGGNYSGLSLAVALGAAGIDVIVLERGPKKRAAFDGRTLALSFRSMQLLEKARVAASIIKNACPILDIRVADDNSSASLDFDHADVGDHPFGWIVENHLFHHALEKRLRALKHVHIITSAHVGHMECDEARAHTTLENGRVLDAALIVGADGRNSWCRKAAGIPTYGWNYRQTAIACVIRHSAPHKNIAVEHFHPGGPFATLPMTDDARNQHLRHRSSVIWTEKTAVAESLMQQDERAFTQSLQAKVEDWLGTVELAGRRFAYPIALQHAERYTAPRLALIGDAAHSIHPIAGQGFNLGMGDIAVLVDELIRAARLGLDPGNAETLRRYEKRRKFDNGNMVLMTDGLVRLFSNAVPPIAGARRLGLTTVHHMSPLKRFFMRTAMGLDGTNAA
jgi:2-octaprenyl-6-methoxyphenol hydroxylase